MVSELSIAVFSFYYSCTSPPPDGHCAGGTHPTGMHSCFQCKNKHGGAFLGCNNFTRTLRPHLHQTFWSKI